MEILTLVPLDKVLSEPVERIGQKAARLGTISQVGFNTPPGLIIPAEEVARFWKENELDIPESVAEYIWRRCQELFGNQTLIVRSSGIEDGETLSFTGQFASIPDVKNCHQLGTALKQCICSSRSEEVRRYAQTHGVAIGSDTPFAVLIMPQRRCVCSGILFSKAQLHGSGSDKILIQVARGNNFGLTSGTETGEIIFVDRETGEVKSSIPTNRSITECSDEVIDELRHLALQLETECGFDVDVEWGIPQQKREPEIFQVRPITLGHTHTANNLRLQTIVEAVAMMARSKRDLHSRGVSVSGNVWSDQNIAEIITDHPSQMAFGIFTYIFAHGEGGIRVGRNQMGYDVGPELTDGFFELIGGRPRCSIAHDALTYRIKGIPLDDYISGFVQRYLVKIAEDPRLANYPEVVLYEQNPSEEHLIQLFGEERGKRYARIYQEFFAGIRLLEGQVAREFSEGFLPKFRQYIHKRRSELSSLKDMTLGELVSVAQSLLDHLRTTSCVMFVRVNRLGFFAYARLLRKLAALLSEVEGRHALDVITAGLAEDASSQFNVRLADYRDKRIGLEQLLGEFGHLGPNELEIANPRFRDQVPLLIHLAENIKGDPREELRKRSWESRLKCGQVLGQCAEDPNHGSQSARELRADIEAAKRYLPMREVSKFHFLMEYDLLRRVLIALTHQLGIEEELIFELDPRELPLLLDSSQEAVSLMRERRQKSQLLLHLPVPPLVSRTNVDEIGRETYDPDATVLMGIGITPITMTGRAVVVLDPQDREAIGRISAGCVLVTKTTDPTWAPIIAAVGGNGALVTEIGGPLAHGAMAARDFKIACVQNVPGVTKRVKTGNLIRVDGRHGVVTILEE